MPTGKFDGKRVIVTGGARGIGLAAVRAFLAEDANVLIADLDREETPRAAEACGANWVCADISCQDGAQAIARAAQKQMGGTEVLINNAALPSPPSPFHEISPAQWDKMLQVNLNGAYHCVQALLEQLSAAESASIVNIVSTQGLFGQPGTAAYSASKGGVISLTRTLAVDLAPHGIRVNAVAPGFINTRMAVLPDGSHEHDDPFFREFYLTRRRIPLARPGMPDDVAGPILFLAGEDSRYMTGQVLAVDGGLSATY